ncbi:hypothetical protein [Pseudogemmobacter sonorensis]|uniref:hypothetical protein n=1 Tax=Pseudogemmobacter sonorensis TaxID=2989681 RepID=UPI0036CEAA5E
MSGPTILGRHENLVAAERAGIADAYAMLRGGVLGNNAFPESMEFVFSHGPDSRFRDSSGNEYIVYVLGSYASGGCTDVSS